MKVLFFDTPEMLGAKAATLTAALLNTAIHEHGCARLLMSTGASQFTTIQALTEQHVDWTKVEMFHLDEYIGLDPAHPAGFVKYLQERFTEKVNIRAAHFVDTTMNIGCLLRKLTAELEKAPVDVGLIGIGENAHIAFNDPPADFSDSSCYKVVTLDAACRNQQLREGWFSTLDEVPKQALSMTVSQILKCGNIISAVPYAAKAMAVRDTLTNEVTNRIPATILKTHPRFTLLVDKDSASLINPEAYRAAE